MALSSIRIDAAVDRLQLGTVPLQSEYVISVWANLASDRNTYAGIWCFEDATGAALQELYTDANGTTARMWDGSNGGFITGPNMALNTWYHFVWRRKASDSLNDFLTWKQDGGAYTTVTGNQSSAFTAARLLLAWNTASGDPNFGDVRLAGLKVWNTALSQGQAQAEGDYLDPQVTAGLHSYHPLQSVGTMLTDTGPNGYDLTNPGGAGAWVAETGPAITLNASVEAALAATAPAAMVAIAAELGTGPATEFDVFLLSNPAADFDIWLRPNAVSFVGAACDLSALAPMGISAAGGAHGVALAVAAAGPAAACAAVAVLGVAIAAAAAGPVAISSAVVVHGVVAGAAPVTPTASSAALAAHGVAASMAAVAPVGSASMTGAVIVPTLGNLVAAAPVASASLAGSFLGPTVAALAASSPVAAATMSGAVLVATPCDLVATAPIAVASIGVGAGVGVSLSATGPIAAASINAQLLLDAVVGSLSASTPVAASTIDAGLRLVGGVASATTPVAKAKLRVMARHPHRAFGRIRAAAPVASSQ